MSNTTTRTPEPQEPETMPDGWPPKSGAVGDHVRRWLAWYLLGASLLTLAGLAWTIVTVRKLATATDYLVRATNDGGK